jgi:hypothetical protein
MTASRDQQMSSRTGRRQRRTIAGEVSESQSSLALNLQTLAVHQRHKALDEFRLGACQLLTVRGYKTTTGLRLAPASLGRKEEEERTIDGDVAESGGAIVLNVGILRVEQVDEDGDGSSCHELLSVLV